MSARPSDVQAASLLEGVSISKSFGGTRSLSEVSISLAAGQMVGLIGPNGAGKSTLVNVLGGQVEPDEGRVRLAGEDITRLAPSQRSRRGVGRTFQGLRLFEGLTCAENVLAAAVAGGMKAAQAEEAAHGVMGELGLLEVGSELPKHLPFGAQKLVSLARVLVASPKVLLLDEPFAGLTPDETEELAATVVTTARAGKAVLLVEHDLETVAATCDTVVVVDRGRLIAKGTAASVFDEQAVWEAYFGDQAPELRARLQERFARRAAGRPEPVPNET